MRNRLLPLALLGLALLAGGGLWLATRGGAGGERAAARPPATRAATEPSARAEERPAEPPGASSAAEELAPLVESIPRPGRAVLTTERDEELARALWVEGRVVIPADTPRDERVRVVAKGRRFKHGQAHAVGVAEDGTFRVAFAEGTKTGWLELEARYLFLEESYEVTPGAVEPVVLEATLGGVLRGRMLPPPGEPGGAQRLIGCDVMVSCQRPGRVRSTVSRRCELDASLAFVFNALPPDALYYLRCDNPIFEPAYAWEVPVLAGRETIRDLQLELGVDVAGRVIDAGGAPVPGASVGAWTSLRVEPWLRPDALTDPRGEFVLRWMPPGAITLVASADGYLPLELKLGELERGAKRSGLVLKLDRGLSIPGSVVWAGGKPAEGARVHVEPQELREGLQASKGTGDLDSTADRSGRFAISGLEPGPYRVIALAKREETVVQWSEPLGRDIERALRTTLSATLSDVEAGTAGLVLEISNGETVRGVVVDDHGNSVEAFRVSAKRVEPKGRAPSSRLNLSRFFTDAGGAFELGGFQPGSYRLEVTADGYLDGKSVKIEVPLADELAPIRLKRPARVSGVVLTPQGERAARAKIETAHGRSRFRSAGEQADRDGRFEVADLQAGALKVRATLQGYAPSEPLELELERGGSREDVVLRLRTGAKLTGLVVDADGNGLPLRDVRISGSTDARVTTDEDGAFELEALEPGTYSVTVPPTQAELEARGFLDVAGAQDALSRKAEVEVRSDGGHIVLAVGNARAVRVFGTVTREGKPLLLAGLELRRSARAGSVLATAAERGAYEIVVPEPGDYELVVHDPDAGKPTKVQVTIQGPDEQRLDVDVPAGPPAEASSTSKER